MIDSPENLPFIMGNCPIISSLLKAKEIGVCLIVGQNGIGTTIVIKILKNYLNGLFRMAW